MMGDIFRPFPDVDLNDIVAISSGTTNDIRDGHWRDNLKVQDFEKRHFSEQVCPKLHCNEIASPHTRAPHDGDTGHDC